MITITAKYVGPHGFRGFANGDVYELAVVKHEVITKGDTGRITYNSLESFLRDWVVIFDPRTGA